MRCRSLKEKDADIWSEVTTTRETTLSNYLTSDPRYKLITQCRCVNPKPKPGGSSVRADDGQMQREKLCAALMLDVLGRCPTTLIPRERRGRLFLLVYQVYGNSGEDGLC